ncbi:hypothetical protein TWF281_001807 [Arthrobotrys megalospora]
MIGGLPDPTPNLNLQRRTEVWAEGLNYWLEKMEERLLEEGVSPPKELLWGHSLNNFRWVCEYRHREEEKNYLLMEGFSLGDEERTIFKDPYLLSREPTDEMDSAWECHTEWPLHMGLDGDFSVDTAARARLGVFEVVVDDEALKKEIWEEVGCGTPEPVRGPQKRAREPGDEEDSPPRTRKRAR